MTEGERSGLYIIDKLRPVGKGNFTELKYNGHITIKNIPPEAHEYIVNGRSPLGWIIDQYQVSIDKDSGIKTTRTIGAANTTILAISSN